MTRKIGLKSLNNPIDMTTPQGRLIFNLFASLSEFEKAEDEVCVQYRLGSTEP